MSWILFSSTRSPFVRKVLIAAHETGLSDRLLRQDIETNPMRPSIEVLKVNPLGMIPTLIADDEVIFDSLTILEFLDERSQTRLFPVGATARRECLTRHAVANGMMDKAVRMLDETFRAEQNGDTAEHIAGFSDAQLRAAEWMGKRLQANRFDAGDIAFASALAYLDFRFSKINWRSRSPDAAAWFIAVSERSSMSETAMVAPPKP
ncbi:glutathione S-transferase family protein [Rhizobium rhizogenes]|uniref:glutathione S-transferase family protein n=1 Tax=Rhizobium rhizogenes TaxID=359 RepID=UPI0015737519|nr:glutathione S-transferase [Rhizobium rhizogenes]NTF97921.1 glutathione S-transferase [Rhizobium rhizogenes]